MHTGATSWTTGEEKKSSRKASASSGLKGWSKRKAFATENSSKFHFLRLSLTSTFCNDGNVFSDGSGVKVNDVPSLLSSSTIIGAMQSPRGRCRWFAQPFHTFGFFTVYIIVQSWTTMYGNAHSTLLWIGPFG